MDAETAKVIIELTKMQRRTIPEWIEGLQGSIMNRVTITLALPLLYEIHYIWNQKYFQVWWSYLKNGVEATVAVSFLMEASIETVRLLEPTARGGVKILSYSLHLLTQTSHNAVTYLCVCMSQSLRGHLSERIDPLWLQLSSLPHAAVLGQ